MKDTEEQSSSVAATAALSPERQRFLDNFNLFPKGNPETTFTVLNYAVNTFKLFDGTPVTADHIYQKWKEYIDKCQTDARDQKYIKSMESFITSRDFNINFSPSFEGKSFLDKYA